jgi:site-specific recombinase XerD
MPFCSMARRAVYHPGQSTSTGSLSATALAFFAEQGVTELADITPTLLRLWFVHLQERNWKENSVHSAAVALRAWLNWCVAEELLSESPLRKVKLPRRSRELLPAFSDEDVRALLAACGDSLRDRALILLLLDTGVRASECVALNVGDISADGASPCKKAKAARVELRFWDRKLGGRRGAGS